MPVNIQMNAREYSFDDAPMPDDQGSSNSDAGVAADTNAGSSTSPQPVICPIETETLSESEATPPNALPDPMLRFGAAEFIARGGLIIYPSAQETTTQPPAPPPAANSAASGIETAASVDAKPAGATPIEKPPTGATSAAKDSANNSTLAKSHGTAVPSHDSAAYTAASDYGTQHGFDAEQTNQLAALFAYYHCETPQHCKDVLNSLPFHISSIMQAIGGARADGTFDVGLALRGLQEAQAMMNGDPNAGNRNLPDGRGERGVDPMSVQQVGGTHGGTRAGAGQGAEDYAIEMSTASSAGDATYVDYSEESYDTADNTPSPDLDPLPSMPPIEATEPIMLPPSDIHLDHELAAVPLIGIAEEASISTRTPITDLPDALTESAANARVTNDTTSTNPPLTLNPETGQYGRDYGNGVWSYPLETSPLESHNLLATNNADTISADTGLIDHLSGVYQAYQRGDISLSDALSMAAGNVRFSASATNADYSVTTRLGGAAQAVGGFVEGLVGLGLSETVIGAVIGVPIAAHGIDNMFAGERTMVEGNHVSTLTVEALEYAGMSPMAAELTNAGLGLVGTVGPGAVRAVAVGRAAQAEEVTALGRNANDLRPFEMPDGPSPGVFEDIANTQREAGLRPYVSEVAIDETTTPGTVTGAETRIRPQEDAATTRSLMRENETAEQLAEAGYDVERNPNVAGSKEPDYLINGEIFDAYSPDTANVRSMSNAVEDKIISGQTERVVINLVDSAAGLREVIGQFSDFPIPGLRELFIFDQNGNLTILTWTKGK